MDAMRYDLPAAEELPRRLAAAWLVLGVIALIGSGLLAILLVGSRTPALQQVIFWRDFFHTALVIHVDLSVLIWFLAFAGVLWSLAGSARAAAAGWTAWALSLAGTLALAAAPFAADGNPLMNNYVPVLRQDLFFGALIVVASGFGLLVLRAIFTIPFTLRPRDGAEALRAAAFLAALIAAIALAAFAWSWLALPMSGGQSYYEMLFWSGGHVLQFTHALLAAAAWIVLADACGAPIAASPRTTAWMFALAAAPALAAPLLAVWFPPGGAGHVIAFSQLMKWGHLAGLPLGVLVAAALWRGRGRMDRGGPLAASLLCSLALFAAGGVLGFLIQGVNVVIPAHYHGSIVGVTLAFMGLTYRLLPRLGFAAPMRKLARWQAYIYAFGQFLHISGLAWSGGYGVQRKVAGAGQVLKSMPEVIGMGMMGAGGLIAIIGGILFLVVCLRSMWPRRAGPQGLSAR
ncbi:MAG: hypothetical protein AUK49_12350 [Betaproteobacteria bacterium CG2_30_68_42]|nr:MAG: hypothetical protein AUK49_12350 [Betaproteobacteria bacterium CG2_30_68_42]